MLIDVNRVHAVKKNHLLEAFVYLTNPNRIIDLEYNILKHISLYGKYGSFTKNNETPPNDERYYGNSDIQILNKSPTIALPDCMHWNMEVFPYTLATPTIQSYDFASNVSTVHNRAVLSFM